MSNKKRIARLIWRKYDLPIIISNWKKRVSYGKTISDAWMEMLEEKNLKFLKNEQEKY